MRSRFSICHAGGKAPGGRVAFDKRVASSKRVAFNKRVARSGRAIGESGFSIIEVLVASVILVVGLTGYLSVAASTTDLGGRNTRVTNANAILYDLFDQLKATPYASITATTDMADINATGDITTAANGLPYTRTVALAALADGTPQTVARVVTITVSWSWKGFTHVVSQSSVFMAT